jgi:4-alpha-glucanotransferase
LDYNYFLHTHTKDKWQKIGINRRAGVVVPLFSVYSERSTGIGEIPDVKLLLEWCKKTGISIIQLLPLNDVGDDFAPYSSLSTFALDPMYLSLRNLIGVDTLNYENEFAKIKKKSRPLFGRVNYKIKKLKLELLWLIYKSHQTNTAEFNNFIERNNYWLRDYALFKVIGEDNPHTGWDKWEDSLKYRDTAALKEIEGLNIEKIRYYYWMQWQLHEQMKEVKKIASVNGIYIMGDLPFLVSGQSADVWAHQNYFLTELSAGAPPDMYFALGQKWGMPPYNWNNIADDGFLYLREKLKYAENFYDMYRIDHFVGLFRVWVSPVNDNSPDKPAGSYMPPEEYLWESHGRKIIDVMAHATSMLPCAEDLGTVPGCSYHVLSEFGIPGIDFQRYYKENFRFKTPGEYRINSQAVISTHDSSFWINWWQYEAGTIDEKLFELMCQKANIDTKHCRHAKSELFNKHLSRHGRLYWKDSISSPDILLEVLNPPRDKAHDFVYMYMESFKEKLKFLEYLGYYNSNIDEVSTELVYKCLDKANQSASIFSMQLLHEYLGLDVKLLAKIARWNYRLNTPGKVSKNNWSLLAPLSLEELLNSEINPVIKELNRKNFRY